MKSTQAAPLLITALLILVAANLATHGFYVFGGYDHQLGLHALFDFNQEWNVPSFYSASLIFTIAIVLGGAGLQLKRERRDGWQSWLMLAAVFAFLSVDEVFALHEDLTYFMRDALNIVDGIFYFAWIIPGLGFALAVLVLSVSFLRSLDRGSLVRTLLAGAIYITGAVVFEMLGGWRWQAVGQSNTDLLYIFLFTCEETLEMAGMSLMLFTVLRRRELLFGAPLGQPPALEGQPI